MIIESETKKRNISPAKLKFQLLTKKNVEKLKEISKIKF